MTTTSYVTFVDTFLKSRYIVFRKLITDQYYIDDTNWWKKNKILFNGEEKKPNLKNQNGKKR